MPKFSFLKRVKMEYLQDQNPTFTNRLRQSRRGIGSSEYN
jgi:hypothetical protein